MVWVAVFLAFWVGSIPFSWLLVWLLAGVDLRTVGSGNPGATNAMRVVGRKWGGLAMALDIAKGWAATAAVPILAGDGSPEWLPVGCGCAAILGNVFCPFFRFRGGKAVSTAGGVFLGLAPRSALAAIILFFSLLGLTRKTSVCSLAGAAFLPLVLTLQWHGGWGDRPGPSVILLAWSAAILVVFRHRENIRRLVRGEESGI
jgi:glycerol-3-phosphate acyltransferase PlsY